MGKRIVIILLGLICSYMVFASFSGRARIGFEYDAKTGDFGIANSERIRFSYRFDFNRTNVHSTGEGGIYAEIEANANAYIRRRSSSTSSTLKPRLSMEITKANIIAGDLKINILGPKGGYGFAGCFTSLEGGAGRANGYEVKKHGLGISYKDYSFSFAYYHTEKPLLGGSKDNLYAGVKTPHFELADGLTVETGANFKLDTYLDESYIMNAGGGFRFSYSPEDSPLYASFSTDAALIVFDDINDRLIPVDIAASLEYDFIKVNFFFGTTDSFYANKNAIAGRLSLSPKISDSFYVEARATAIHETVEMKDSIILCFFASLKYTARTIDAHVSGTITMHGDGDRFELKPWTSIEGEIIIDNAGLGIEAGISSDVLIDNATVALDYKGSDFSTSQGKYRNLGKVSASITVEF